MTSEKRPTLVKDIMVREVATISPMASLREAMREMRRKGVKSLVVEKSHEHDAYGIITYTNVVKTIYAEEGDIDLINVYDVCTKPAISVSANLDVKYVARLMVTQSIRRVLVLDNNELEGIISMNDIIDEIIRMTEED
ncbi:MAG TPA: CBS domain-containing protein [Halothiobacillus sp.]|nr:CBS domain-containing protein [Halothiobacillus sp.]